MLDTYQLKSLDALVDASTDDMSIVKQGNKFKLELVDVAEDITDSLVVDDNFATRKPYDKVVQCLGFQFDYDIFNR